MIELDRARLWISLFVISGLLLAVGVIILTEMNADVLSRATVNNESLLTLDSSTNQSVANNMHASFLMSTTVTIYNVSNGYLWNTGNYTAYDTGLISWYGDEDPADGLNITYTYTYSGTTESSVFENSTIGLSNMSKQLPTVGTVLGVMLIVIVLVIMTVYFGRRMY